MKSGKWIVGLCVCLAVAAMLFLLPARAEAAIVENGSCGDNLTWTLDDKGTLIISGTGSMKYWNWYDAPWYEDARIKKVIIEEGVTTISSYTFAFCENLTSVSIPNTVTSIGHCTFQGCSLLRQVVVPDSVETLGNAVFSECVSLEKVKLSKNLTKLNDQTFKACESLKSIVIPDSVTSVGEAFAGCFSLESITVPKLNLAFGQIFGIYHDEEGNYAPYEYNQNGYPVEYHFFMPPNLKTVTITGGVLQSRAFSNYTAIETLIIGENVTEIQDDAFLNCTFDTVLFLGEKPTISANAFRTVTANVCTMKGWTGNQYGGTLTWKGGADKMEYRLEDHPKQFYGMGNALEIPEIFAVYSFGDRQIPLPAEGTATLGQYDNSTPGNKTVTVTFAGENLAYDYIVVDPEKIVLQVPNMAVFDGAEGKAVPVVSYDGIQLTPERDYIFSYKDNTFVGNDAQVTVTGLHAFEGWSVTKTFSVLKADLSDATVTGTDQEYSGSPVTTTPAVAWNGLSLRKDRDYVVAYRDNVAKGTATIQILGIGNYKGVATGTFEITDPATSKTIYYGDSSVTVIKSVTIQLDAEQFCSYKLYRNGSLMYSSSSSFTKYVSTSFSSTGTYTLELSTQGYIYIVQGGQYRPVPSGSVSTKTFTIHVVSGPGETTAPTALTPGLPTESDFRTLCLTVSQEPSGADIYPMTWQSSDTAVATVENGVLTFHKAGKTTVTATVNGLTANWEMDIAPLSIQSGKLYYNAANQTVEVIYEGQLLTQGVDYTVEVTNEGEYDELVLTGCGLFGGTVKKQFTAGTDEPYCMGDIDGNLVVNTDDVVQLLLHISMPDMFPIDAPADFDADGFVTTDDAIKLLLHISMPDMFPL